MAKTNSFGTTFKWAGAAVGGLTAINGIEVTAETTEVTDHNSPDGFKEHIPTGVYDSGEVGLDGFFDPADTTGQQAMLTAMLAGTVGEAIITFPVATKATWTFDGIITRLKIGDAPVSGAIPFSASIKPTGKPVFAIATT